ncbi:MAG: hypothetical protein SGI77_04230 [Pirellulaceae bacterium]|nr:hypothetical protein [Pirellulaceae bacterium]
MTLNNSIPIEDLRSTIHRLFSVEIEPGSIADQFRQEGRQEGERRGALIGTIQTCQSLLGGTEFGQDSLGAKTVEELTSLAEQLQANLRGRYNKQ